MRIVLVLLVLVVSFCLQVHAANVTDSNASRLDNNLSEMLDTLMKEIPTPGIMRDKLGITRDRTVVRDEKKREKKRVIVQKRPDDQPGSRPRSMVSNTSEVIPPDYLHVYPESKAYLTISKVDVNRLFCEDGKVIGEVYSRDKGIIVNKVAGELYLRILPDSFAFKHPFEFYVICGNEETGEEETYTMIIDTAAISTRTVILHTSWKDRKRLKKAMATTRTDRIKELVRMAYRENFDESMSVRRVFESVSPLKFHIDPSAKVMRYLVVDDSDWILEVYVVAAQEVSIEMREEQFVDERTVAVSVLDPRLTPYGFGKVVRIIEKTLPVTGAAGLEFINRTGGLR